MGNIFAFEGGVVVKECRIFIFTALFICLTAVKLCFPAVPAQAVREISRVICGQADYGEAIQAMGRAIGRGELVQVLNDLRPGTGALARFLGFLQRELLALLSDTISV